SVRATARSLRGLAKLNNSETATASGPAAATLAKRSRSAAGAATSAAVPSGRVRSAMPKRNSAGASGAADGDGVLEAGGGKKGDARAFALEQGIGADGGAVANFRRRSGADLLQSG